jgi:hypothetical protein
MERSTTRVFASRQRIDLRAASGRGTKVEAELVVIPGYSFWIDALVRRLLYQCRKQPGCYHQLLNLPMGRCGNPGVITSYLFIQVLLHPRKNRDEFINYTDVLAILPLVELVVITGYRTVCFFQVTQEVLC